MKVACISQFSNFVGGGEYSLFDLMRNLPADVKPVLLVPSEGELSARADQEGVDWYTVPIPPIGLGFFLYLPPWLRLLRDLKPAVLHANSSRAAFYAGLAGRMRNLPVLFHCRVDKPDPRLDWLLARLVNGVIANSGATAKRFSAWPKLRVWTIHNGVDVSAWSHGDGRSKKKPFGAGQVLLVVARASRGKRHDIALEVFDRLSGTMPDLHLVCVGGRDPTDEAWWDLLQRRTDDLRNGGRVHWVGGVSRAALKNWYSAADVLLLPSDDESFGRVLVEAMAAGVPPVAFAVGGVPEVVEHGKQGFLVPEGDVQGMVEAVAKLLDDGGLRRKMGEAGRKHARRFSVERHVERVCEAYRELTA